MDDEFDTLFTRTIAPGIPFLPATPAALPPPTDGRGQTGPRPDYTIREGMRLTDDDMLDLTVHRVFRREGTPILVVCGPNATSGGWCALKMLDPDALAQLHRRSPELEEKLRNSFAEEALHWCRMWPHPFMLLTGGLTRLTEWSGLPALVMEYAAQGTLADRIDLANRAQNPQRIPLRLALGWAQQIALALAELHKEDTYCERHPLTHADVKPDNVLLTGDVARLADFGLSRTDAVWPTDAVAPETLVMTRQDPAPEDVFQPVFYTTTDADVSGFAAGASAHKDPNGARPTSTSQFHRVHVPRSAATPEIGVKGSVAGTFPYMPPEQWEGGPILPTASDVYAFGVLLFELFAGMPATPHVPSGWAMFYPDPGAWSRAHSREPLRHLTDKDLPVLERGPLAELAAHDSVRAGEIRQRLSHLITRCLALRSKDRPAATVVAQELAEIARGAGLTPVQTPSAFQPTSENEAAFWSNLAATYAQYGDGEMALTLAEKAVRIMPLDPLLHFGVGKRHYDINQFQTALSAYQRAENLLTAQQLAWGSPISYMLPKYEGIALYHLSRFAEAVDAFRRSLARRADSASTSYNLAKAYRRWADHALALQDVDARRERLEHARAAAQEALRLAPNSDRARELLASIEQNLATL